MTFYDFRKRYPNSDLEVVRKIFNQLMKLDAENMDFSTWLKHYSFETYGRWELLRSDSIKRTVDRRIGGTGC